MADPGHIPGAVYIPRCIAVRLRWRFANSKEGSNVLHASYTTPPTFTQTSVNNLFTAFQSAFSSSLMSDALDVETTFVGIGLRDMAQYSDATGTYGLGEFLSNNTGITGAAGPAGGPLPHQVAF